MKMSVKHFVTGEPKKLTRTSNEKSAAAAHALQPQIYAVLWSTFGCKRACRRFLALPMFIFILGMIISFQFINPRPKKATRSGDKFKICRNMVINCWVLRQRTEQMFESLSATPDTQNTHQSVNDNESQEFIFNSIAAPFLLIFFRLGCVIREFVQSLLPIRHKSRSIFSTFGSVGSGFGCQMNLFRG